MRHLALLPAALLFSLGAASAAPSHLGPPSSATVLSARAGVGGVARPGRWLPVEITISGDATAHQGVLRVEWGDAVVLRDIAISAGAPQHVTVFLRAIAAEPTVHIALIEQTTTASLDVPVELAPLEDALVLCVGVTTVPTCTVRVAEDAVPTIWRGFDVADTVVWPEAARSAQADAARALATWRAMRWLGDAGPADPVMPPLDGRTPALAVATTRLLLFALVVTVLSAIAAATRARLIIAVGVPLAVGLAAGTYLLSPSLAARSDVTAMQLTGVVHQFAGTAQSTLSAKGEIEHANAATLTLQPTLSDATLATTSSGATRSLSLEDRDGRAQYRATAGLGARRRVTLDGTIDAEWLAVTLDDTARTIENRSPVTLSDCHWRGASADAIGTLPPGGRVAIDRGRVVADGDTIACTLPSDWLVWTTSDARVTLRGQTHFVFHFWPGHGTAEPHAAR